MHVLRVNDTKFTSENAFFVNVFVLASQKQ